MAKLVQLLENHADPRGTATSPTKKLTIGLVTSLAIADFVDPELTAEGARRIMPGNVGILTLVALLREKGYDPSVISLDQLFLDFRNSQSTEGSVDHRDSEPTSLPAAEAAQETDRSSTQFFSFVIDHLKTLSYDIFGFSTICSSYPLTIRLAEKIKALNPTSRVILGGPQASVVDVATMQAFPCVDFVIRGEADRTLLTLLDVLSDNDQDIALEDIPGLTFRCDGKVVRNPNATVVKDLDNLPLPAFDLDSDLQNRGSVYLEIGRGCPYACTFCSTNDFFRRNFRLKSAQKTLEEMKHIKEVYGISNFSFVHDMYTVNRAKVVEFCELLLASGEEFTWACSARTDCVDDELIELMAKAGCRGIFFGIETGSERLQKVINKKLNLSEARKRIECADRHKIKTAVALITAFPDETRDDLRDTIHYFLDSLRFAHAEPQLSLLAPLGATPIYEQHKDRLVLDEIFSDVSHQGWHQDPADLDLIKAYPEIFSNFYAVPTTSIERSYFKEVRDLVTYLALRFRWLPVGLLQDSGDFLKVFDRWSAWKAENVAFDNSGTESDSSVVPYYCGRQFVDDFIQFVSACYIEEMAVAPAAIAALAKIEAASQGSSEATVSSEPTATEQIRSTYVPFRVKDQQMLDLGVDYKDLIQSIKVSANLRMVQERRVANIFQRRDGRIQVSELTASSAALMRLCDGKRTVEEIVAELEPTFHKIPGVSTEQACIFGLVVLQLEGLVKFATGPVNEEHVGSSDLKLPLPSYSPPPELSNTQRPWPWSPDFNV